MNREATEVREVSAGYNLREVNSVVPVGYKQTEVGVIPKDWEVKRLREISPRQSVGLVINPSTYFDRRGTVPMLVGSNVYENRIDWSSAKTITEESNEQLPASQIYVNDLVMVRVGEPGVTAVIPSEFSGSNCASMMIVRGSETFDSDWLCYLMNSDFGRNHVKNVQYGTAQKQFNISDAVDFCYPVPSKNEQSAIATALSDVDALLEELDRLIAKKRDLKQATMQQLLTGQTRLPGFDGEWVTRALASIADIRSGGTPSTSNQGFWNGDVPWCTPTDITRLRGSKYLSATERTISHAGLRSSSAEVIPTNSIIMTTRATIGECAINVIPMTTNQGFKNLIPTSADGEYLYYLMTTQKDRLVQLCAGSTFLEIGKKQLERFELYLPVDLVEQRAIARILSDMDEGIHALERRLRKTTALKQAMMQELLTGRTRLIKPLEKNLAEDKVQSSERKANVYFMRSVLAAEIIDQLHEEPTFGHVKFEKMLFLVEHLCEVDTGSTYRRQAAGPYDNKALRSIDSQLRKQQWFEARKESGRYRYVPLNKRGGHKTYFDRYFSGISSGLLEIVETFRAMDTERCEIIATLYSAWSDLLSEKGTVSDDIIVHEVLNHWHESKKRITEDRWLNALGWMREKGFVPKGSGPV